MWFYGKFVEFSFLPLVQGSWDQLAPLPLCHHGLHIELFTGSQKTGGAFIKERKFIWKFSESLLKKDLCFTDYCSIPVLLLYNQKRKEMFQSISISLIGQCYVKTKQKNSNDRMASKSHFSYPVEKKCICRKTAVRPQKIAWVLNLINYKQLPGEDYQIFKYCNLDA